MMQLVWVCVAVCALMLSGTDARFAFEGYLERVLRTQHNGHHIDTRNIGSNEEDPHWCDMIDATTQCSDPEIANKCKKLCTEDEDPHWCDFVDATKQCSDPEIANKCLNLCTEDEDPHWCDFVDAKTQCLDPDIANKCIDLCTEDEDPHWCDFVDATTQCSDLEIANKCINLCTEDSCTVPFELVESQCLYVGENEATWQEAEERCQNLNGNLAEVTEQNAVIDFLKAKSGSWTWAWIARTQMSNSNQWLRSQNPVRGHWVEVPDDTYEGCLKLGVEYGGFKPYDCMHGGGHYICERKGFFYNEDGSDSNEEGSGNSEESSDNNVDYWDYSDDEDYLNDEGVDIGSGEVPLKPEEDIGSGVVPVVTEIVNVQYVPITTEKPDFSWNRFWNNVELEENVSDLSDEISNKVDDLGDTISDVSEDIKDKFETFNNAQEKFLEAEIALLETAKRAGELVNQAYQKAKESLPTINQIWESLKHFSILVNTGGKYVFSKITQTTDQVQSSIIIQELQGQLDQGNIQVAEFLRLIGYKRTEMEQQQDQHNVEMLPDIFQDGEVQEELQKLVDAKILTQHDFYTITQQSRDLPRPPRKMQ